LTCLPTFSCGRHGGGKTRKLNQNFDTDAFFPDFFRSRKNPKGDEKEKKLTQKYPKKNSSKSKHQCLLDAMLQARDEETGLSMTDAQLRDELLTMLIAG